MGGSLRWRLLLPSLMVAILFGFAYSYFWIMHLSNETTSAFISNGQKAAQSIAIPVATGLWEFDESAVTDDLAALEKWDGFVFAQVLDHAGIFTTFPADATVPQNWGGFLASLPESAPYKAFGDEYAFIVPLQHESHGTIGYVVAVFSRDAITTKLNEINTDAALYATTGILIFGAVLSVVAFSVIKPVTRVTKQIEQAAAGDLDIRPTDTARGDEVGRLARAVEVFCNSAVELVSVRAKAEATETVAKMALIDPLTELFNRRGLDNVFKTFTKSASGAHTAFISIDLDDFKKINDMHGHGVGDAVLREVSNRLQLCFPDSRAIARVGGDEFFVLHEVRSSDDAMMLARGAIAEISRPIVVDVLQCHVGASVGIFLRLHPAQASWHHR